MTTQTPPTDRPLTAGDVPLLREGDVLRVVVAAARNQEWDGIKQPAIGEEVVFIKPSASGGVSNCIVTSFDPTFGFRPTRFTFVSRPATSAASEGEGLKWPWPGDDPRHDEIRAAWESYANEIVDDAGKIDLTDVDTCVSIGAMKALSLAALASPPVSERERELAGALRDIADSPTGGVGCNPQSLVSIAKRALTAQPAGEGK